MVAQCRAELQHSLAVPRVRARLAALLALLGMLAANLDRALEALGAPEAPIVNIETIVADEGRDEPAPTDVTRTDLLAHATPLALVSTWHMAPPPRTALPVNSHDADGLRPGYDRAPERPPRSCA